VSAVNLMLKILIVGAGLALTSANTNAQLVAAEVAGCYQLDQPVFVIVDFLRATRTSRVDSTAVMRLYTDSMATTFGGGRGLRFTPVPTHTDSLVAKRWLGISHWRPLGADSIYVEWRNGLWGPVLRLAVQDSLLDGTVLQTTDVHIEGRPRPTPQPIGGRRISCPK
jgi:hypothetical protein